MKIKVPKFELSKIKRLINTQGVDCMFYRDGLNEFKEPEDRQVVAGFKGVFHRTSSHISVVNSEASSVQTKKTPYILGLYQDAKGVKQGDYTYINGRKHLVNGVTNIGEWDIALDISLEEVV